MESLSFVFDPRPNFPLLTTAKRYWKPDSQFFNDPSAVTLIFAHGTSFHKEQWEPTIEELWSLVDSNGNRLHIREVWSIDAPNHGDAAILNEERLSVGYQPIFRWEEYGRVIHSLLMGLGKGIDTDFSKHRLVGVGHSMGAASLLLSMNYFPQIKFESLVLIEVMIMKLNSTFGITVESNVLASGSVNRRDVWASQEDAYTSLKSRKSWQVWDDRVLKVFVKHGLRSLPTLDYPDIKEGLTLKCTRKQETATYLDQLGPSSIYRDFSSYVKRVPIHLVYGAIDDYILKDWKEDVVNNAIGGVKHLASYSRIPKAGHLAVQTNPAGVACAIYDALTRESGTSAKL
ncbi:hypothetical protein Moror_7267 [Moniliophthora roreri MCA 2997]|uniref:AB hydrolase-1 domain-containing protein n=1 Tax=Moniliophthora roreri (strain MCA 2997) TaxID=1381753 RepID=V2XTG9_MONRO|nr:hypothetical protein Moror_7267 [Moniliophthora roreri MCA 2997]